MNPERKFLSRKQLADRWAVSVKFLEDIDRRGEEPRPIRINPRVVRYDLADIESVEQRGAS
jgi:predicted DNA-binding transcriptional regulator AlpA